MSTKINIRKWKTTKMTQKPQEAMKTNKTNHHQLPLIKHWMSRICLTIEMKTPRDSWHMPPRNKRKKIRIRQKSWVAKYNSKMIRGIKILVQGLNLHRIKMRINLNLTQKEKMGVLDQRKALSFWVHNSWKYYLFK